MAHECGTRLRVASICPIRRKRIFSGRVSLQPTPIRHLTKNGQLRDTTEARKNTMASGAAGASHNNRSSSTCPSLRHHRVSVPEKKADSLRAAPSSDCSASRQHFRGVCQEFWILPPGLLGQKTPRNGRFFSHLAAGIFWGRIQPGFSLDSFWGFVS